jgi:kynurenine formamidase
VSGPAGEGGFNGAAECYENLNNLKELANRRFDFYGFPLRLDPAYGSPVRAVGIVDE